MRGILTHLVCLAALAATGCEEDRVSVRLVLRADGSFERTLRLWREDGEKPGEILAPAPGLVEGAAAAHGPAIPAEDGSVAFRGEFRAVPPDLRLGEWTNRGGYTVWRARLGSFAVYRERRPGPTDFHARARAAEKGADVLAAVLRRMLRSELRGEPGLDRLVSSLRGPLREDLKDLLHLLAGSDRPQALLGLGDLRGGTASEAALALQLLEERGWLRVEDLPRVHSPEGALALAREAIAARMGRSLDAPLRKRLAFLDDEAAFERAREALGISEEELEDRLRPVGEVLGALGGGGGPEIRYEAELPPGAKLLQSSGERTPDGPVVRVDRFDERPVRSIFFVAFALPDLDWQRAHFGRTVLDGEHLRDYAVWLAGLPEEARRRWEEAMEGTAPGTGLLPAIRAIRVSGLSEGETEKGAEIFAGALGADPR